MYESQQITELLADWSKGNEVALEVLMPVVEKELRRIAHNYMRNEKNHTLQTTALINEAYLKLVDQKRTSWQNRSHFFAVAANIMRRVLLNHARLSTAEKRGGDYQMIGLEDENILSPEKSVQLIALDEALKKLAKIDSLKSKVVELRYFGGLTIEETAEVLNVSSPTVSLHWRMARAWLQKEIEKSF
ncbi:MAG: sigma-70 family RNA polymerase sigma factor [Pyrinomonadaceae bacterium]|nr:sigma-70 family RNA polymerase sigma factor [Pyrinomonadaceae bacterium]